MTWYELASKELMVHAKSSAGDEYILVENAVEGYKLAISMANCWGDFRMWTEREETEIKSMIEHLSKVTKITKNVTLEVNFDDEEVLMLYDGGKIKRHIDISCDSAYGVLKDVMKYV